MQSSSSGLTAPGPPEPNKFKSSPSIPIGVVAAAGEALLVLFFPALRLKLRDLPPAGASPDDTTTPRSGVLFAEPLAPSS